MDLERHAKEQEERVRQVLTMLYEAMQDIDMVHSDGKQTSFFMEFDEQDVFHALSIFVSVGSNYAIKHGYINPSNAYKKFSFFRKTIKDIFGIDSIHEARVQKFLNSIKQ